MPLHPDYMLFGNNNNTKNMILGSHEKVQKQES